MNGEKGVKCIFVFLVVLVGLLGLSTNVFTDEVPPEFSIEASPSQQAIFPGGRTTYAVVVRSIGEFKGSVLLSVSGLPSGAAGAFDENPVTPTAEGTETNLQITSEKSTPPGTYTLKITGRSLSGDRLVSHSTKVTLVVKEQDCPEFSVSVSASPSSGPPPLTVQFSSNIEETEVSEAVKSSVPGYTYAWSFGDGATSSEANPQHTYQKTGTYTAILTVTNECGDSATDKVSIIVSPKVFNGTLRKDFSPASVLPGEETSLILTVHNTSKADYTDVTIWDELPEILEIVRTKGPVSPERRRNKLIWTITKIARGETLTLVADCKVKPDTRAGKISDIAYLSHTTLKQPIASNRAVLRIGFPDVKIEKSVNLKEAQPGVRLTYTLKALNRSAISLNGVEITDTLSGWLEFVSQDSPFAFSREGSTLKWTGTLAPNSVAVITMTAKLRWTVPYGTRVSNEAFLAAETGQVKKHSETVWTIVGATSVTTSKISFRKRAEIPQVDVGKIIRFRLTIRNNSLFPLLGAVIDDTLPQGFIYVKGSSVYNGTLLADPAGRGRLHWKLPVIAPGETVVLKYQTVIGSNARRGKNVNRAVLTVSDNTGKTFRLEAKALVSVSASSFTFFSAVEGVVYLDKDRNGVVSSGDVPLKDVVVLLSRGERALTDAKGHFMFDALYPGEYLIGINTLSLPEKYKLVSESPLSITLMDGLTDYVEFLVGQTVKPTVNLEGLVFYDKNGNKAFDKGEPVPGVFQVMLDNALSTTGKKGHFRFSYLVPGRHELTIRAGGRAKTIWLTLKPPLAKIQIPLVYHRLIIKIKKGQ